MEAGGTWRGRKMGEEGKWAREGNGRRRYIGEGANRRERQMEELGK